MRIFLYPLLLVLLFGCSDQTADQPTPPIAGPRSPGCEGCHPVHLDPPHRLACSICHGGDEKADEQVPAHTGLIARPAHPDQMSAACGGCHPKEVANVALSLHFSLKNEVNLVRGAFGADPIAGFRDIPKPQQVNTAADLVDDLLRRRCLDCHPASRGEGYPESIRGLGCAACHISYRKGKMAQHAFIKSPPDEHCLHCHFGNRVGADYYGRFEHDFNHEYRTPYRTDDKDPRPYGIEFHQLIPDIHQQKGMACIDCHNGAELMGKHAGKRQQSRLTCASCHLWQKGRPLPLDSLKAKGDQLILITKLGGKALTVPHPVHPAHRAYADKADCTVCHSQWSFNDFGTHLVRRDDHRLSPWQRLAVQGNFEVEEQLNPGEDQPGAMTDKIDGSRSRGLWLLGYELRRWEEPLIGADQDGRLRVFRPILDLHLSMVDQDGTLLFDNIRPPAAKRHRPYTPHTTGKAGAFYQRRLISNLPQ